MNEILKVLFQSIPAMLYEPIAVGAVLGLIVAAVMYWKRHTPLYWWIAFSLIFMIGWRLGIQIISRRYASFLIYPAVIATAYFCFQTELLVKYIPKFPVKWCKIVPYLFVIGLGIASIGQALHYNPYSDYILRAAKLIQNDAKGRSMPHILVIDQESHRLSHYTGFPSTKIWYKDLPDEDYVKNIGKSSINNDLSEPADTVYLVLFESLKREKGYYLQAIPGKLRKQLHFLGEFYHNRKKRRVTRVYRYNLKDYFQYSVGPASNVTVGKKRLYRATFSKSSLPGSKHVQHEMKFFAARPYQQAPVVHKLPERWYYSWSAGYGLGSNGEINMVSLPDKSKALHLKSDKLITIYHGAQIKPDFGVLRMKFSGKKGSVAAIGFHCYDKKWKWYAFKTMPLFEIPGDGVYEFRIMNPDGYFEPEIQNLCPAVKLFHGELFVHNIEIYEQ